MMLSLLLALGAGLAFRFSVAPMEISSLISLPTTLLFQEAFLLPPAMSLAMVFQIWLLVLGPLAGHMLLSGMVVLLRLIH